MPAQPVDPEIYDAIDRFVEDLVVGMPASYDAMIAALEAKTNQLRKLPFRRK